MKTRTIAAAVIICSFSALVAAAAALSPAPVSLSQSLVTEIEGYACMGADHSRKETEQLAMTDARRKGLEYAAGYIAAESRVEDGQLKKDLVTAYSNGKVRVISEPKKEWYRDPALGDCFRVQTKLEIIPREEEMLKAVRKVAPDDPSAPLSVKVWIDRKSYGLGEKVKVCLKGNKPFYGTLVYRDAAGVLVQFLPNPFRKQNYFHGGTVYELPSGEDRYELEILPPFGAERITVYASTAPVGELNVAPAGSVYTIRESEEVTARKSRSLNVVPKQSEAGGAAEFVEHFVDLKTENRPPARLERQGAP